jgi:hypothetical protein
VRASKTLLPLDGGGLEVAVTHSTLPFIPSPQEGEVLGEGEQEPHPSIRRFATTQDAFPHWLSV